MKNIVEGILGVSDLLPGAARVLRGKLERAEDLLKSYRRVFCRFDKLDVIFAGFIVLALIVEALRN